LAFLRLITGNIQNHLPTGMAVLLISSVTFHRRFDTVKRTSKESQLKSQLILAEEASKRACTFPGRIWDWVKKQ